MRKVSADGETFPKLPRKNNFPLLTQPTVTMLMKHLYCGCDILSFRGAHARSGKHHIRACLNILPCTASSRMLLHYLRKPMSQLMQAGGRWEEEQSTFPAIANRFFIYTFSFWLLWIPIPLLHLASSQPHFIIQHAHKKKFHFLSLISLKVTFAICLSVRRAAGFHTGILKVNTHAWAWWCLHTVVTQQSQLTGKLIWKCWLE